MLRLTRLVVDGFGPFADRQVIDFPPYPGVVVLYGENMRGKTTLLNAIRYAFFGIVLRRGAKERQLHTLSNRERASRGEFGFSVSLTFDFDDDRYELIRECRPAVSSPTSDRDYRHTVMLRRGTTVLGPTERDHALARVFPKEVSRFFLFDGELLQEYEELVVNESEVGPQIAVAIERILGVPLLKSGRRHLTELADEADQTAAREAQRHRETEAWGNALNIALDQRQAHQVEQRRLNEELANYLRRKVELEGRMAADRRFSELLQRRDNATTRLDELQSKLSSTKAELKGALARSWRSLLSKPVQRIRAQAEADLISSTLELHRQLRVSALHSGTCEICTQRISDDAEIAIRRLIDTSPSAPAGPAGRSNVNASLLRNFVDDGSGGEARILIRQLLESQVAAKIAKDEIADLDAMMADLDVESIRTTQAAYAELIERVTITRGGLDRENERVAELDVGIDKLRQKLRTAHPGEVNALERRARLLRESAGLFDRAVESYKIALRSKVEATATELFLAMTTEHTDYSGLRINSEYGLTILHRDGLPEEARSAGAEHVVALALMGALQHCAPLTGPIVMDSPFGRLDEQHTSNVVCALPKMAEQVVLLVYESEIGRDRARTLLGPNLVAEYELVRESSRRTSIKQVT